MVVKSDWIGGKEENLLISKKTKNKKTKILPIFGRMG